jgi:hypothetical protein
LKGFEKFLITSEKLLKPSQNLSEPLRTYSAFVFSLGAQPMCYDTHPFCGVAGPGPSLGPVEQIADVVQLCAGVRVLSAFGPGLLAAELYLSDLEVLTSPHRSSMLLERHLDIHRKHYFCHCISSTPPSGIAQGSILCLHILSIAWLCIQYHIQGTYF